MQIGSYLLLPNPSTMERLQTDNAIWTEALGGPKRFSLSPTKTIYTVRFGWEALNMTERAQVMGAISLARESYVLVVCPGLGGGVESSPGVWEANTMYMTLSKDFAMPEQWEAGYVNGEGPILDNITAELTSLPMDVYIPTTNL